MIKRIVDTRPVSPNSESALSREYVADWLEQVPEFACELGIDLDKAVAPRLEWLGSGGRADAVLITAPDDFRVKELQGRPVVLKITNDRAQAMMSQVALSDEPVGVVPIYDVVETDIAPRAQLPELPAKGEEAFYVAQTWGILEKLVVPLDAARRLEGITVAGSTPDELISRYAATWRAYDLGGVASDPLVEDWRLQYAAAIEWIEDTCEAIGSRPLLDLHEGNWGVDPDSGDLVLLDLGQCYVPSRVTSNSGARYRLVSRSDQKIDVRATVGGKTVGRVGAVCYTPDWFDVSVLAVDSEHQRQGIGLELLRRAGEEAASRGYGLRSQDYQRSAAATRVWEKLVSAGVAERQGDALVIRPATPLVRNARPKLEEGVTVVVERHPVYDHGAGHTAAHKATRKRVKSVKWVTDELAMVRLHGATMKVGGHTIDRPFRFEGSDRGGWWLTAGPPGPLRYLIVGVQ